MAERRNELDWLRVLAVVMLIYYHTAAIFVHWDSVINNGDRSVWADIFVLYMDQWFMPLFFVIAGAATRFSLEWRKPISYAGERTKRLLVPLVFGIFVVVPPQVFYERLQDPIHHRSFPEFYLHLLDGVYPAGNLSWHHLWFVAYVFVFSLVTLPGFLWLRTALGRRLLAGLAGLCGRSGWIFLPALGLAASEAALRARYPGPPNFVDDWASVFFFAAFYACGYVLYSDERLLQAVERGWKAALVGALVSTSTGVALFLSGKVPGYGNPPAGGGSPAGWILLMVLRGFNSWSWVLVWVGLARRHLRCRPRWLGYANEAAYPFYILHLTAVVVIGYYVVQLNWGVPVKYLAITTSALVATLAVYHLLVRPIPLLRFLFGMKPPGRK